MLRKFKNIAFRAKEKLGFSFFTGIRSYEYQYNVELKNNCDKSKEIVLIVPVPFSTDRQTLLTDVSFQPNNPVIQRDELYGNPYSYLDVELKPFAKLIFSEKFNVRVSPALPLRKKRYSFDQYTEKNLKRVKIFMAPNHFIDSQDERIMALASDIRGDGDDVVMTAKAIYKYVITRLDYKNPILGLYTSRQAFEQKEVDCGGFSSLFVAMSIACGIPARIVSGFLAGYKTNSMHAWAEFMLPDGRWIPIDAAIEQEFSRGKTRVSGKFGFVGSDRVVFSHGCEIPVMIRGKKVFLDILQNPFIYPEIKDNDVSVTVKCLTKTL